jgi:predicted nucleotidyltransferase
LDLVVEFSPMSPKHALACFGLLEELENLFARRVDLVEIGAVLEPYLRGISKSNKKPPQALSGPLTQNW